MCPHVQEQLTSDWGEKKDGPGSQDGSAVDRTLGGGDLDICRLTLHLITM